MLANSSGGEGCPPQPHRNHDASYNKELPAHCVGWQTNPLVSSIAKYAEFVEGGLKQRETDIRRRELEMIKRERQIVDEDEIEILLEEKKLEEEEKRL